MLDPPGLDPQLVQSLSDLLHGVSAQQIVLRFKIGHGHIRPEIPAPAPRLLQNILHFHLCLHGLFMGGVSPKQRLLLQLCQPKPLGVLTQRGLRLFPELDRVKLLQTVQINLFQWHGPEPAGAGGIDQKPLCITGGDQGCPPGQYLVGPGVGQAVLVPFGGDEGLQPLQVAAQRSLQLPQLHDPRGGAAPGSILVPCVQPLP